MVILLILILIAGAGYYFGPWGQADADPNSTDANGTPGGIAGNGGRSGKSGNGGSQHPQGLHFIPYDANTPTVSEARAGVDRALAMLAEKPYEARELLKHALNYGKLPADQAGRVREAMENLAKRTIFNRSTYVHPKDPYTTAHKFEFGELLVNSGGKRGVISRRELWVPAEGIVMANGLANAGDIKAMETYKMLKGPCHAVVYKSERAMDVYLQDLFVKRMRVAIGKPETPTPEGTFTISDKVLRAGYRPPGGRRPELGNRTINPGEPGYPLDPLGHWMALDGIGGTEISAADGYAIHGTNEPDSIGTAASLGCIRLGQQDIIWAFRMLYQTKATVTILP
jgi:hypothetical protein